MTRASHPQPRLVPREQGVGWAQNVSHTPAWTLERGHQSPGPEVLCARNSKLVQVGSHSTKMTPLRGDLCAPPLLQGPQNTPQTPPHHHQSLQTVHVLSIPASFLPGIQSEFFINTTRAGPGTLSVTIEGPSKVKMDCQETPEGYKVMYTPMAPGNYLIGVKYGGPNHIVGSPFKAKVTGNHQMTLKLTFPLLAGEVVLLQYRQSLDTLNLP